MRILVCGGAGYIGSNMVPSLAAEKHDPVVYDNLSKGHKAAVADCEFVKGDLGDYDLLVKTLKKYKIDAVFHFAGLIEVGESVQAPLKYYHNNVSCTQVLLSAMEAAGVEKFIFSSSAAVYGLPKQARISENAPTAPINPYGESKLAVEKICHYQNATGKLRYASLRYFNAAGAGNNCTLGEDHRPESHLIPLTIAAAMGKTDSIKIYGTDYPTPDGSCIRDYIHIEDLCRAHLLAMNKLDNQSELIYNLGNGNGCSVKEVIETVKKVSGKNFKVVESQRRPGDAPILTANAAKAINELLWKPKFTDLEKIIETAWLWHNKFPNGYPE
ncbi:MAG: UDP-glucose 4-epimerase GalE [Phycisphaerae bacterium]|nr:UDP-glucose 4-epimerase GalE [Phycisphaerae bacterium]MDD5381094.1 UDP-glucose 4-epimerase GalE [Phycisphaerae bacterium]